MTCLDTSIEVKRPTFQVAILGWAESNIRHYVWRDKCRSPYEIMVAELLLKRTTATAVAHIYEHFLRKYPNVTTLAQATENNLIQDFKSIGLHTQRARSAVKLAQYLINFEANAVPSTFGRLTKVPGLGSYSARAVLSFGYDEPTAVVDANVVRVLGRVFERGISERPSIKLFQEISDAVIPKAEHRQFNFAMIDLGALVCRYAKPNCSLCPLASICDHNHLSRQSSTAKQEIPSRARQVRREKGLSLVELARKANVSKLTIINIEAGRTSPRPETLGKLAEALSVPISSLTDPEK